MLEEEFNMVQPESVEKFKDKISAIFVFASFARGSLNVTTELLATFPSLGTRLFAVREESGTETIYLPQLEGGRDLFSWV